MSRHWDRIAPSDEESTATSEHGTTFGGQGHDRILEDNPLQGLPSPIAMSSENDHVVVDITAGQKMLSAMSGSLFTSLLGKSDSSNKYYNY